MKNDNKEKTDLFEKTKMFLPSPGEMRSICTPIFFSRW